MRKILAEVAQTVAALEVHGVHVEHGMHKRMCRWYTRRAAVEKRASREVLVTPEGAGRRAIGGATRGPVLSYVGMSATAQPPAGLRPGFVLDRYELIRHVARGGMGSVWLARLTGKHGFTKHVAIKTIAPELADSPQFHAMFLEEARISSKLAHANVAQVLDVGEHDQSVYIVFEWVEGKSLEEICRGCEAAGQRIPLALLLRVLADACAGLDAAHELVGESGAPLGVVHRDVTPNNVLVSDKGFAKVIDFGIAKSRDRVQGETRSGLVKGTPQYMSPEHACREPLDRRTDVWSLGAVLFRALAGAPPFADHEALLAYMDGGPGPRLPPDVPPAVRAIVERALQVERRDRFATAADMRRALERALHEISPEHVSAGSSHVFTARDPGAPLAPTELAVPSVPPPAPPQRTPPVDLPGTLVSAKSDGPARKSGPADSSMKPLVIALVLAAVAAVAALVLALRS